MTKRVTIIVPTYNGRTLLEKNLPGLVACAGECEIIVVDDGSTDSTAEYLRECFPRIVSLTMDANGGFARACNAGVRQARGDIVYLLNSDVSVSPGFLDAVLPHFQRPDVFAVGSFAAGTGPVAAKVFYLPLVKFKWGIFWYWYEKLEPPPAGGVEVFCVSGGHAAFDRAKFLALGGFDELFRPFYAEDGDLCWRAWKRGWKSICEPRSVVTHACKGTIGRLYTPPAIRAIHWKNRFLMTWKDITAASFVARHLAYLIPELCVLPLVGKAEFTVGFWKALRQLPELIASRKTAMDAEAVYTDGELFARFSAPPSLERPV